MTSEKKQTKYNVIKTLCEKRRARLEKSLKFYSEWAWDGIGSEYSHKSAKQELMRETQGRLDEINSVIMLMNEKSPQWLEYPFENGELLNTRQAEKVKI